MRNRVLRIGLGLVLTSVLVLVAAVVFPRRLAGCPPAPGAPTAAAASFVPVDAGGIGDSYFPRSGDGGYDVASYDNQVRYEPATDRLHGQTTIVARATEELSRFELDLRLPANAVTVDDRPAAIRQDRDKVQITPAVAVRAGASMTVRVDYAGVPSAIPDQDCDASPWLNAADGAVAVGEPDIAPWWYPANDHPLDKATFTITAVVPASLQAISNGALLGGPESAGPGWQRWRWQHSEPMATYLAFVAIGHYDIVRRDTPFGPYPFRQLGGVVPDTPTLGGSLEAQTRPVYASEQFTSGERVTSVVHELSYARRSDSDEFWETPPGDPGAERMFKPAIYERGAMALHALRVAVGDEDFFTVLRTWTTQRRGGNGAVADFLALIQRVSGKNVDTIAHTWLFTPTRPPSSPAQVMALPK